MKLAYELGASIFVGRVKEVGISSWLPNGLESILVAAGVDGLSIKVWELRIVGCAWTCDWIGNCWAFTVWEGYCWVFVGWMLKPLTMFWLICSESLLF